MYRLKMEKKKLLREKKLFQNKEIENAGWLITGRLIQLLFSFLISLFTARYLGPKNYGVINYIGAYVAFFSSLCSLGINSVIVKDFVENPEEQGMALGSALVFRMASSVLSFLMIIGIVSIVDQGEPETVAVAALCGTALIFQVFDTFNYWFQSRYQSKVTAIAALAAYMAASIYKTALLFFQKGAVWFAFANSIDFIFLGALLLFAYRQYRGPRLAFSWKKGKALLGQSYHYIFSGMMVAVYGQTDKLMLKQLLDEASVGYYSLAFSISSMWGFILNAVIDSVYPTIIQLYAQDKKAFERKNRQLYAAVIYLSVCMALVFLVFGKILIRILYGDKFLAAAEPLKILAWHTLFSYLGVARNAWVVCENKQKYLKYMYFSAAMINVLLNMACIPAMGVQGAAFASLLTQVCTSMVLPCFMKDMRPNVRLMADAFLLRGIK